MTATPAELARSLHRLRDAGLLTAAEYAAKLARLPEPPPRRRARNGTGGIWFDPAKRLYIGTVRFRDPATGVSRRHRVSGKTWTAADSALKAKIRALESGTGANGSTTLQAAVDAWAATLGDLSMNTQEQYRNSAQQVADRIGPDRPLTAVTALDVDTALREFAATKAVRTVNHAHQKIAQVFAYADLGGKVAPGVAAKVAALDVKGQGDGRPTRCFDLDQAQTLIKAAQDWPTWAGPWAIVSVCDLGPRPEELKALTWADVADGEIRITRSIADRRGGAGNGLKTSKSRRHGPLTDVGAAALAAHRARQAAAGIDTGDAALIFPAQVGASSRIRS